MAESEAIKKEILEQKFEFQGNGKEAVVNWTLGDKIGIGAFSKVYKGKFCILGKDVDVAVKVINRGRKKNEKAIQSEMNALETLSHERIIVYYGISLQECDCFVFMEYMSFGTLRSLINIREVLSDDKICLYTKQLIQGITYLHSKGIMHRDIKSDNILLNDENIVKLSDFGCSKFPVAMSTQQPSADLLPLPSPAVGTSRYMALEMLSHRKKYTYAVDIWSLGCVVMEMFTGEYPFIKCKDEEQVSYALLCDQKLPLEYASHRVPDYASKFLKKIFKFDPAERPSSDDLHKDSHFFKGGLDRLHKMVQPCIDTPKHKEFIPIARFSKANLPEGFRDIDLYELIRATSDLTVLVVARDICLDKLHVRLRSNNSFPYKIYETFESSEPMFRYGSGEISSIFKYEDGCGTDVVTGIELETKVKACPCRQCTNSQKPKNVWWEIFILTAEHIDFNCVEVTSMYCELFFDEDDGSSSREILKDFTICNCNVEEDRCQLKYVTCDEKQGNKLYQLVKERELVRKKVLTKFKDSRFMFMVSHPHGCTKQVSMGELKENIKLSKIDVNVGLSPLQYLMTKCENCSVAAVHCIGHNHQHAHKHAMSIGNILK